MAIDDETADPAILLRRLYQHMTMKELQRALHCSHETLTALLDDYGITIRRRGRYTRRQFSLTEDLFSEICRDGISAVAYRIGMSYTQLHRHVRNDPRVKEWSRFWFDRHLTP